MTRRTLASILGYIAVLVFCSGLFAWLPGSPASSRRFCQYVGIAVVPFVVVCAFSMSRIRITVFSSVALIVAGLVMVLAA